MKDVCKIERGQQQQNKKNHQKEEEEEETNEETEEENSGLDAVQYFDHTQLCVGICCCGFLVSRVVFWLI